MIKKITFIFFLACSQLVIAQNADSIMLKKISDNVMLKGECYKNLEYLCKKIGNRISGSENAQKAVDYTFKLLKDAGADTVYLQECMVPQWVRGKNEIAKITTGNTETVLKITALGGSVGTPNGGIKGQVVEVKDFDELKKLGKDGLLKGKMVFYNHPFNQTNVETFKSYGEGVKYRYMGPSEAARYGAIASIVRSVGSSYDDFPHTGVMKYNDSLPQIPCVAISTVGADVLSQKLNLKIISTFYLQLECKTLPDVKSYNVIGEIKGTEFPKEYITVGGHLDSWDIGEGAHDDGAGCVQSIEVLRTIKSLGIKLKRTLRVVMFMNEESAGRGGEIYFETAKSKNEKHILAIESDAGGFSPRGFSSTATEQQKNKIKQWAKLFMPYGVYDFDNNGGGADIEDLNKLGAALLGLLPDSQRYFSLHHTDADVFEAVNERELKLGAAVMTMMVFLADQYGLN
jgi:hypothetical protein